MSRAPLPNSGVTSVGETWSVSWESITPPSSLILAHSPLPLGSLLLRLFASVSESLQVVTSPCCPRQLPDVIPRTFPWMLDPLPRRYTVCSRLFLPRCHRPSPTRKRVGFPHLFRLKRLLAAELFEDADISLCSGLQVCSPPRSSLPLRTPAGQPGLLHPSRTRFVASPRIGYANRPKTSNWRCGDLHPARLRPCRPLLTTPPRAHTRSVWRLRPTNFDRCGDDAPGGQPWRAGSDQRKHSGLRATLSVWIRVEPSRLRNQSLCALGGGLMIGPAWSLSRRDWIVSNPDRYTGGP